MKTPVLAAILALALLYPASLSAQSPPLELTGRWEDLGGGSATGWRLLAIPGTDVDGVKPIQPSVGTVLLSDPTDLLRLDPKILCDFTDGDGVLISRVTGGLRRGYGYWVKTMPGSFRVQGVTPPSTLNANISVTVHAGWNLLGNPFVRPLQWAPGRTILGTETAFQSSAFTIAPNGSYREVADGGWIPAFSGFWVKVSTPGTLLFRSALLPPGPFCQVSPSHGASMVPMPATFTWSESPYATTYRMEISASGSFTPPQWVIGGIAGTTHTLTAAQMNQFYAGQSLSWRVLAENPGGSQIASNGPFPFTVGTTPPPEAFGLISPGQGSVQKPLDPTFRWSAAKYAVSYRFELTRDASFSTLVYQTFVSEPSVTYGGPLEQGLYYWRVWAYNASAPAGLLATNGPFTFWHVPVPGPFLLYRVNIRNELIYFSWAPSDRASYYQVEMSASPAFTSLVYTWRTEGLIDWTFVTRYVRGGVYYCRVWAYNSFGRTLARNSPRQFTNPVGPMPGNFSLQPVYLDPSRVCFSWTPSDWASLYVVEMSETPTFETLVYRYERTEFNDWTFPNLYVRGRTYYWRVRAVNAAGSVIAWNSPQRFTMP